MRANTSQPIVDLITELRDRGYGVRSVTKELGLRKPALEIVSPDGDVRCTVFEADYFRDPHKVVSRIRRSTRETRTGSP